jgi:hypothetical protein
MSKPQLVCHGDERSPKKRAADEAAYSKWLKKESKKRALLTPNAANLDIGDDEGSDE